MITRIHRKIHQLANDPTLRRWLVGRALGRWPGEPPFAAHHPPYLSGLLPLGPEAPNAEFESAAMASPEDEVDIHLAGETLTLNPSNSSRFFQRAFADIETQLALHRFAWLPLMDADVDPAWARVLWQAWRKNFGTPSDSWAWHPYTAAERAVNILAFARRHGLPGDSADTLRVLAAHAPVIAAGLEYFGEHHTSNHLSNNGRGLYLLGLELGLDQAANMGAIILGKEFERIFSEGGVLREGSSHYQLLLARNYVDAWLAARRHGREEIKMLEAYALKALSAAAAMTLPGGLPRIGDISPDCSPAWLSGLLPGGVGGWLGGLSEEDTAAYLDLRQRISSTSTSVMADAGWHRLEANAFAIIAHAAPGGWTHMPGHGHQDMGSFELHHGDEPVIVDPGRGAYGETGEAATYRSGRAHNGLMVDGADPYPPNRPYYDETFRRAVGGPNPQVNQAANEMTLTHHGFSRLSGVGVHERQWHIAGDSLSVTDSLGGSGHHDLVRTLITPLTPRYENDAIVLQGSRASYRLGCDDGMAEATFEPIKRWHSYGSGTQTHAIRFKTRARLPWRGAIILETR